MVRCGCWFRFTSIYAQGNVGIATTDPRTSFQVGGSPDVAGKEV